VSNPSILLFRDPADTYSNGLATIFTTDVGNAARILQQSYTADKTTAATYQQILQSVFSAGKPSMIFFAGRASDALRMGQALDALGDRTTKVLSDDAFYDPAQFIAYGKVYKGRYSFTGYFYPDEGSLLPKNDRGVTLIMTMEDEYAQNFHAAGRPLGYGFARVPSDAALFYDAVKMMAMAIGDASGAGVVTRDSVRSHLAALLYQGISGQIHFNQTPPSPTDANPLGIGDPIDKAMLVMHLDDLGHTHPERILGVFE